MSHLPDLLEAAERVDVEEVRRLLREGADPNTQDTYFYTALTRAVGWTANIAQGPLIDALIAAGADPNLLDQAAQTPLMHAAHRGNLIAARHLLAGGAKSRMTQRSERDALHIAVRNGYGDVARAIAGAEIAESEGPRQIVCAVLVGDVSLIRRAARNDLVARDVNGMTALHAAAAAGELAMIDALAQAGAPMDAQDVDGLTPLIIAAHAGDERVVTALVDHGASTSIRMRNWFADDALSAAARRGHESVVRVLLEKGAPLEPTADGRSPLAAAASAGHEAIVVLLIERGGPIKSVGAVQAAASSGKVSIVQRLLAAGGDPNERTDIGEPHYISVTPLLNAIGMSAPRVVSALVAAGADVNTRDPRGETPLIVLANCAPDIADHLEIARILLDAGADVTARSDDGETALSFATRYGNSALADLLRNAGARE